LGLIQVPRFDVDEHLLSGELVEVMPGARPAPMPAHLVYPSRRHLSRRVQAFLAWLEALLAPHVMAGR
jgi:DNA-binding transcriptional LysR family regulator